MEQLFRITLLMMCLAGFLQGKSAAYSTYACYGDFFSEELCPSPSVIHVTGANFGVNGCRYYCCPHTSDCQISVTGDSMVTIMMRCNGKQRCDSLQATSTCAHVCGVTGQTNYVTIYYDCLQDYSTIPPTITSKKSTTEQITWTTPKTLSIGSIVGIEVGVIVFSLILLATVVGVVMKRKGLLTQKHKRGKGQPDSNRSENHTNGSGTDGQVAIISGQQLQPEDVSYYNQGSTEDQQPYESLLHQTYTPLIFNTKRASTESITPTSLGNGRESHLQSNKLRDSYLEIIEPHKFLSSGSATIPQAYLTVPFSAEGGPPGSREGDCHLYAEIDKPYNTVLPVSCVQGISHEYLEVGPDVGNDYNEGCYETIKGGNFA